MTVRLECSLHPAAEYALGAPIIVSCSLHNAGGEDVWVLRWGTFLEGLRGNFLRISSPDGAVGYDGRLVKRGQPLALNYVRIAPGETVTSDIDVTAAYAIKVPGDYPVSLHLRVQDAFDASASEPPRRLADHQGVVLDSAPVTLHVVGGGEPVLTEGERARAQEAPPPAPEAGSGPPAPTVIGGTASEVQLVHAAHSWAYQAVLASLTQLTGKSAGGSTYGTWFGAADAGRLQTIISKFTAVKAAMVAGGLTYDLSNPQGKCDPGDYAYTYLWTKTIYVCGLFWSWWSSDDAEQAQTCVHELMHAAAGVDEQSVYGEYACEQLAASDPATAIDNADNYGYYAISVCPESPESDNGVWEGDTPMHDQSTARPTVAASASAGTVIFMYQDSQVKRGLLYFRAWTVSTDHWGATSNIKNATTRDWCQTGVAPAATTLNGTFYCAYVDGDKNSPTWGQLVCVSSSNAGAAWSPQQAMGGVFATVTSPALAALGSQLYCVYAPTGQTSLECLIGTVAADEVQWAQGPSLGVSSAVEPSLGTFNGTLYCAYTGGDNMIRFVTTTGGAWTPGVTLATSVSPAAPALAQWNTPQAPEPVFLCLYRGVNPDSNLRYIVSTDGVNWDLPYRESGNRSSLAPAMAAYGTELFACHIGVGNSNIYRSLTVQSPSGSPAGR